MSSNPVKEFYVITEEYYDDIDVNDKNVLYAFECWEEANYVLHLLIEEDTGNFYKYELSCVNNNHPYEKISEEEMKRLRRERDAHKRAKDEMEKQKEYVKESHNRFMKKQYEIGVKKAQEEKIEKKKQEREAECQEYKEKIDDFLNWLQHARNAIAEYNPNKEYEEDDEEDDEVTLYMTPKDYENEANYKLSQIKNDIQQYLLDHQDEQILELVNKPVFELLNLPPPTDSQNNTMYIPKRLRQMLEQEK